VVDFRSDWALLSLPLRFRTEQSFLGASDEPLGPTDVFCAKAKRQQQVFFVRKRSANVVAAADVFCAKAKC